MRCTSVVDAGHQTGWNGPELTAESWRQTVRARLEGVDWQRAAADARPFLEDPAEVGLLTEEIAIGALMR